MKDNSGGSYVDIFADSNVVIEDGSEYSKFIYPWVQYHDKGDNEH
jgi:hypothetical protein